MYRIYSNSVLATEVADFLGRELVGDNVVIYGPSSVESARSSSLIYLERDTPFDPAMLTGRSDVLILTDRVLGPNIGASCIFSSKPAADFITVLKHFFTRPVEPHIHATAVIEEGAKVGAAVHIHSGCFIGRDVEIGDETVVFQNVVLSGPVKVGRRCVIKANSTIGSDIFDFVFNDGEWEQFPQIGQIRIGDNVWIGANTTIEKGSLNDTVLEDGVKIDDLVQIGSSSVIGRNTRIAAGSVVCRSVTVGRNCWISPQVSIKEGLTISDDAVIGLGAVVIRDVDRSGGAVVGNPAKPAVKLTGR